MPSRKASDPPPPSWRANRPPSSAAQQTRTLVTPEKLGRSANERWQLDRRSSRGLCPGQTGFCLKRSDGRLIGSRVVIDYEVGFRPTWVH